MDIKRESLVSWANTNRRFSFNFPLFVLMLRSNNRRQLLAPGCWRMILWGWDFRMTFIFCCIFRARFLPEISGGDKARYEATEGRWKRRGGGGKKKVMTWDGANIFGIQILAPQMYWKSLSPCSVFSCVLFLSRPRQKWTIFMYHSFKI